MIITALQVLMCKCATAHTAFQTRQLLQHLFPQHCIGLHFPIQWPSRSPDLSICDFFLWGCLKEKVYAAGPFRSHAEIRAAIRAAFDEVRSAVDFQQTLRSVWSCFLHRLQQCIDTEGQFIELRAVPEL